MNAITTKHNLDFEACAWPINPNIQLFRIGSCEGQWQFSGSSYDIIAVINNKPGNGHLDDVFEWFEYSCKRDGVHLRVMELMNDKFKTHLINKRGFKPVPKTNNLIKVFK